MRTGFGNRYLKVHPYRHVSSYRDSRTNHIHTDIGRPTNIGLTGDSKSPKVGPRENSLHLVPKIVHWYSSLLILCFLIKINLLRYFVIWLCQHCNFNIVTIRKTWRAVLIFGNSCNESDLCLNLGTVLLMWVWNQVYLTSILVSPTLNSILNSTILSPNYPITLFTHSLILYLSLSLWIYLKDVSF